jgi:2-oxoisovalerate dehydrogenase E1 component
MTATQPTAPGSAPAAAALPAEQLIAMYRTMLVIRSYDAHSCEQYSQGLIPGHIHPYTGQEAIAVGATAALAPGDNVVSNHRGQAHAIALGADVRRMMAELMGRATGTCGGRGGPMHYAAVDQGLLGCNGIVGGGIPLAVGAALAARLSRRSDVTLCFFSDGAAHTGAFHEAVNLAAIWELPVVFLCENNQYGMGVALARASRVQDLAERAAAYGIPGVHIDGNDVYAVYEAVRAAAERARAGLGPTLIEAMTFRMKGHYFGDPCAYLPPEEVAAWAPRDPVARFEADLIGQGVLDEQRCRDVEQEVGQQLVEAVEFARASAFPETTTLADHVFAPAPAAPAAPEPGATGGRVITLRAAINEALREEMRRDERVFVLGEDVARFGGCFQVTQGLAAEFGEERVRDTPIAEAAIVGAAVGAAMRGMRPVAEIMYMDFATIAMDQIVNQAAKLRYMSAGQVTLPLVLRLPAGAYRRNAAQHSQSLEAWFAHVPGLKVVMPATPYDAKGLLKAAIRDDNPVVFIEHKTMYRYDGPVPEGDYVIPLGVADVKRAGSDMTVVATAMTLRLALQAAGHLEKEGISVEVIDPRTIVPLDLDTIVRSVRKTHRLVVVHEACKNAGIGAEIAASVMEQAFYDLEAPIARVAGRDVPMPYSPPLDDAAVPQVEDILQTVRQVVSA